MPLSFSRSWGKRPEALADSWIKLEEGRGRGVASSDTLWGPLARACVSPGWATRTPMLCVQRVDWGAGHGCGHSRCGHLGVQTQTGVPTLAPVLVPMATPGIGADSGTRVVASPRWPGQRTLWRDFLPQQRLPAAASRPGGRGWEATLAAIPAGWAVSPGVWPCARHLELQPQGPVCGPHATSWRGRLRLEATSCMCPVPAPRLGRPCPPPAGSGAWPRAPDPTRHARRFPAPVAIRLTSQDLCRETRQARPSLRCPPRHRSAGRVPMATVLLHKRPGGRWLRPRGDSWLRSRGLL